MHIESRKDRKRKQNSLLEDAEKTSGFAADDGAGHFVFFD
jgi:hypothetical protein